MQETLASLGRRALTLLGTLGRSGQVLALSAFALPGRDFFPLLLRQIHSVGVLSLLIIVLSAFSIGAVIGLQFYTQLLRFGAEATVGVGLAIVVTRELGPVVTALLFAGRAGSALTAEIGLMKATEQLSSMEMMGVDPLRRVVAPRLWAGIISLPILSLVFCVVAIWGGTLVAVYWLGADEGTYWAGMNDIVEFERDVLRGVWKTVVFGVVVTWIAVFQGYDAEPTAAGISAATTRTVVYASVGVLALDFLLTLVMYGGIG
jgi:phospholipid/cholesterol/gamma-HCH transport system permease protein